MLGLTPPVPWGLVAAAVIAVCVTASGWYVIHGMRKADAEEIRQLAHVAEQNRAQAARERAHAASWAANAEKAAREQAEAHRRTQGRLDALREMWDAKPEDDPCRLCTLDLDRLRVEPEG